MTKKQAVRTIAFILAFFVMVFVLCDVFEQKNVYPHGRRLYTYRTLHEDTVDAVIFGTSGIDWYWVSSQAYEDYGMTVYPYSTPAMPAFLYKEAIQDALLYQSPKLLIIDIRPFTQSNVKTTTIDPRARRLLDAMSPFSPARLKAGFKTMEIMHRVNPEKYDRFDLSYLFSFIKYKKTWMEDDFSFEDAIIPAEHEYLGTYENPVSSISTKNVKAKGYNADFRYDLDPIAQESLYDLIEFVRKEKLEVLFLDTPQVSTEKEMGRSNIIYEILRENDMPYVHYYSTETETGFTIDFDMKTEFYNPSHVNFYGAKKFTKAFSEYLDKNYDFEDHRSDPNVKKDWDGVYDSLLQLIEGYENNKNAKE